MRLLLFVQAITLTSLGLGCKTVVREDEATLSGGEVQDLIPGEVSYVIDPDAVVSNLDQLARFGETYQEGKTQLGEFEKMVATLQAPTPQTGLGLSDQDFWSSDFSSFFPESCHPYFPLIVQYLNAAKAVHQDNTDNQKFIGLGLAAYKAAPQVRQLMIAYKNGHSCYGSASTVDDARTTTLGDDDVHLFDGESRTLRDGILRECKSRKGDVVRGKCYDKTWEPSIDTSKVESLGGGAVAYGDWLSRRHGKCSTACKVLDHPDRNTFECISKRGGIRCRLWICTSDNRCKPTNKGAL